MARRRGRNVHGVLTLDKPSGVTSNDALQRVKRLYGAARAGHTGSLDKLATGLLPLCLGEATKLSSYLLEADKSYVVEAHFGVVTTTGDADGEILPRPDASAPLPDLAALERVLPSFRGTIEQVPPMYSALKYQGRRLHELAREGIEVKREPRQVRIDHLESLELKGDKFRFRMDCSKGTYVRTLVADLGEKLGCGASVSSLRRVRSGPFLEEHMVELAHLEELVRTAPGPYPLDPLLLPPDRVLENYPELVLDEDLVYYITQGQPVQVPRAPAEGLLRLYEGDRRFLGVGEILGDGRVAPRRLLRLPRPGTEVDVPGATGG